MKLILERIANRANYCIGKLYKANEGPLPEGESGERGLYLCDTLEPHDTGFTCNWDVHDIKEAKEKAFGPCAIPTTDVDMLSPQERESEGLMGYYPVLITKSPRFGKWLPQVIGVPGYAGIRIHGGNYPKDTEGCILPGWNRHKGTVEDSQKALHIIMQWMQRAFEKGERVPLEIRRKY